MTKINLDGRKFSPAHNSKNGRVKGDSIFAYSQLGGSFSAVYDGEGFTDGHLIGVFTGPDTANLVYHCRGPMGELEVGEATANITTDDDGCLRIHMDWHWLNLDQSIGRSQYKEVK